MRGVAFYRAENPATPTSSRVCGIFCLSSFLTDRKGDAAAQEKWEQMKINRNPLTLSATVPLFYDLIDTHSILFFSYCWALGWSLLTWLLHIIGLLLHQLDIYKGKKVRKKERRAVWVKNKKCAIIITGHRKEEEKKGCTSVQSKGEIAIVADPYTHHRWRYVDLLMCGRSLAESLAVNPPRAFLTLDHPTIKAVLWTENHSILWPYISVYIVCRSLFLYASVCVSMCACVLCVYIGGGHRRGVGVEIRGSKNLLFSKLLLYSVCWSERGPPPDGIPPQKDEFNQPK